MSYVLCIIRDSIGPLLVWALWSSIVTGVLFWASLAKRRHPLLQLRRRQHTWSWQKYLLIDFYCMRTTGDSGACDQSTEKVGWKFLQCSADFSCTLTPNSSKAKRLNSTLQMIMLWALTRDSDEPKGVTAIGRVTVVYRCENGPNPVLSWSFRDFDGFFPYRPHIGGCLSVLQS